MMSTSQHHVLRTGSTDVMHADSFCLVQSLRNHVKAFPCQETLDLLLDIADVPQRWTYASGLDEDHEENSPIAPA